MIRENEGTTTLVDGPTRVQRTERELIVTRTFDAPPHIVFKAWTTPALMQRWWVPKSAGMELVSCDIDARVGGSYRFVFKHPDFPQPVAFFGKYLEVTPGAHLVWTNEESEQGAISTLTLEAKAGKTLLVLREAYKTEAALEENLAAGNGYPEQFEQLDLLLPTL